MKRFASLLINHLIAFIVGAMLLRMFFLFDRFGMPVALTLACLDEFKYFTVLSNLVCGVSALTWWIAQTLWLCRAIDRVPRWAQVLKYASTTLVALTFAATLCYIVPRSGLAAFRGYKLWFHLIVPALAVLDFALLSPGEGLPRRAMLAPLIFTAAYCALYWINLLCNGYGGRSHPNDWYAFATEVPGGVPVALAAMMAGCAALSALLRRIWRK